MVVVLVALALIAASGLPGLVLARSSRWAAIWVWGGGLTVLAGAILGLVVAVGTTVTGKVDPGFTLPLPIGAIHLVLDPLAAFFLIAILFIGAAGIVYGLDYWRPEYHPRSGPLVRFFYGTLVASMGLVVLAANAITFLMAWELMSLAAFAAIVAEDHRKSVRQGGWLYLVNTHLSMLVLFAMFALWRHVVGTFEFVPLAPGQGGPETRTILFVLALIGFGAKAGMMPFHFWLPDAHASAPSHVSALLSGVVIKMGIYGLIRVGVILLPQPPVTWGVAVLVLGLVSGILGVVFALAQHDLKRLLAYHSIENIGIILMGLGVALIAASAHNLAWEAVGLAGCLLHVWNHGLFKSLLFLAAGAVIARTHTRQIDHLGGLAKVMPWTAGAFVLGAIAICGLPPLNGFISEWMVYMGLLGPLANRGSGDYRVVALAAPGLALIGTLAVACFVKVYGTVFLGIARRRTPAAAPEHKWMVVPMVALAAGCVVLGLVPMLGVMAVTPAIQQATGGTYGEIHGALAPVKALSTLVVVLAGAAILGVGFFAVWTRRRPVAAAGTWDCGYAAPSPRMQYTASSFAASIVELFRWILRPHGQKPALRTGVAFPPPVRFWSHVGDVVLDGCLFPAWGAVTRLVVSNRGVSAGSIQRYLILIWLTLAALLATLLPWGDLWTWLVERG